MRSAEYTSPQLYPIGSPPCRCPSAPDMLYTFPIPPLASWYSLIYPGSRLYTRSSCNAPHSYPLYSTQTAWSSLSDERLQIITGTYETPLDDIKQIKPTKDTWNKYDNTPNQVGVTAQSLMNVVPEAVQPYRSPDDGEEYLTASYTMLIPIMIVSIQALTQNVEALEAQLAKNK